MRRYTAWTVLLILGSPPGATVFSRIEPFDLATPFLAWRKGRGLVLVRGLGIGIASIVIWCVISLANEGWSGELFVTGGGMGLGVLMVATARGLDMKEAMGALTCLRFGLSITAASSTAVAVAGRLGGEARPSGLFDNPNEMANVALAYLAVSYLLNRYIGLSSRWPHLAQSIMVAVLALYATQSRSVLLSFCLMVGAHFAVNLLSRSVGTVVVVLTAGVGTYLVAFSGSAGDGHRPGRILNGDVFYRENWSLGFGEFLDSPLFGNGVLGAQVPSTQFLGLDEIHNTPIFLLSSGGVVGCVVLLWMLKFVWKGISMVALSHGGLPILIGLTPKLLFGNQTSSRPIWVIVMGMAMAGAVSRNRALSPDRSSVATELAGYPARGRGAGEVTIDRRGTAAAGVPGLQLAEGSTTRGP